MFVRYPTEYGIVIPFLITNQFGATRSAPRSASSPNSVHDHAQFSLDNKRQRTEIKQEREKIYAVRTEFLWNIQIALGDTSVSIPWKCRAKIVFGDAHTYVAIYTVLEIVTALREIWLFQFPVALGAGTAQYNIVKLGSSIYQINKDVWGNWISNDVLGMSQGKYKYQALVG